jgi:CopG family nickel-responsive transcriptional regulator
MARPSRTRTPTSTGTSTRAAAPPARRSSAPEATHALSRIGVAIDADLLARFDARIAAQGYGSRSEAFRDLIRGALIDDAAADDASEAVGAITLVYDHHERTLNARLTAVQHAFHHAMLSTLHVHLDHDHCLEVVVVRGRAGELRRIADALVSLKGVTHGSLTLTTPLPGSGADSPSTGSAGGH